MNHVRVLFAAANPRGTTRLHLDEEMRRIEAQLAQSMHAQMMADKSGQAVPLSLRALWAPQLTDLVRDMTAFQPSVLHFSGHGEGQPGLLMSGDEGRPASVDGKILRLVLGEFSSTIRLVILNACYSHIQAEAICQKIDSVIGMKDGITDRAATLFAAALYGQLALGSSVGRAFRLAQAIMTAQCPTDADIPCLLYRSGMDPDQLFLEVAAAAPAPEGAEWKSLLAANPPSLSALRQAINLALPKDSDLEAFVQDLRHDPRYARVHREWGSDMRRQRKLSLLFDYGPTPSELKADLLAFVC